MAAEVVLGWIWIRTRHESGYAQFSGQQHLCLFGLQLLLDSSLGQWQSMLNAQGYLFLDIVFFFGSSLFRTTFYLELGLWFSFCFLWLHLLFWFRGLLPSTLSLHLTYVYDMCKCGGVLQCRVHRPKYPSKSPLFLGSVAARSDSTVKLDLAAM
jgi:hypothetical protein